MKLNLLLPEDFLSKQERYAILKQYLLIWALINHLQIKVTTLGLFFTFLKIKKIAKNLREKS